MLTIRRLHIVIPLIAGVVLLALVFGEQLTTQIVVLLQSFIDLL